MGTTGPSLNATVTKKNYQRKHRNQKYNSIQLSLERKSKPSSRSPREREEDALRPNFNSKDSTILKRKSLNMTTRWRDSPKALCLRKSTLMHRNNKRLLLSCQLVWGSIRTT